MRKHFRRAKILRSCVEFSYKSPSDVFAVLSAVVITRGLFVLYIIHIHFYTGRLPIFSLGYLDSGNAISNIFMINYRMINYIINGVVPAIFKVILSYCCTNRIKTLRAHLATRQRCQQSRPIAMPSPLVSHSLLRVHVKVVARER